MKRIKDKQKKAHPLSDALSLSTSHWPTIKPYLKTLSHELILGL